MFACQRVYLHYVYCVYIVEMKCIRRILYKKSASVYTHLRYPHRPICDIFQCGKNDSKEFEKGKKINDNKYSNVE